MVAFVPMNINREESIETVLLHVDHAINYGEDVEPRVRLGCDRHRCLVFWIWNLGADDGVAYCRSRKTMTWTCDLNDEYVAVLLMPRIESDHSTLDHFHLCLVIYAPRSLTTI